MSSCEAQWLLFLFRDLGIKHDKPINTKHIGIYCHVVRERLENHTIHLLPINTSLQLADIFTKSLSPSPFHGILSKLGTLDIHLPTLRGCVEASIKDHTTSLQGPDESPTNLKASPIQN
ncbi:unnamed protein product [Lupinus luteus]|uniref:Uncharacterized protein n=1 Tax=Lupinus luteus TaxID=3873 RepID=A0AAV1VQL1_LUPLU